VTLALLSACAYLGVLAYAATREDALGPVVGAIGALGAVLLTFVLVRGHDDLLGWALGLDGLGYAVATIAHGTHVDGGAPVVALGLLLCGELAAWSLDERRPIPAERSVVLGRATAVAALALASLAAAALVTSLAAASLGGGLVWTAFGALAAVLALGVVVRVASATR
jgi:hypothetical protein